MVHVVLPWRRGQPDIGLLSGPTLSAFTTKQEAKPSCPARRNIGSGIFGRTSRYRIHQRLRAGYHHRNLGKNGGLVQCKRPTEFYCARRGTRLSTELRAQRSGAASVGDAPRCYARHAGVSGRDQLDREYSGTTKAGKERSSRPPTRRRYRCINHAKPHVLAAGAIWPVLSDISIGRATGTATFLYVCSVSTSGKLPVGIWFRMTSDSGHRSSRFPVQRSHLVLPKTRSKPEQSRAQLRLNNATRLSGMEWRWPTKRASVWVTGGARRQVDQENPPMRIYIIGNDGITLCREAPATVNEGEIAIASMEELHAARLSGKRLLALWNALPGVEKRRKIGDREALIDQLWSAIERLPDPEPRANPKRPSKQDVVIAMLQRPEGATVEEVASAMEWQRHTVRGLFSGTLKKKLGLALASAKEERGRVYRVAKPVST